MSGVRTAGNERLASWLTLLLGVFCLLSWQDVFGEEDARHLPVKRILVLDSHSQNDGLSEKLNEGLRCGVARQGVATRYEHFNLYTANQPGIEPTQADVEYLQHSLDSGKYDLVMLVNNAAVNLFLTGRLKAPAEVRLVVMSYYGPLAQRAAEAGVTLTGVETPFTTGYNIRLAMKLLPNVKKVVVIGGAHYDPQLMREIPREELRQRQVEFVLLDGKRYTTQQMLDQLEKLPHESVVIYQTWNSKREQPQNNYAILPMIRERFHGLILSPAYSNIRWGTAGGYLVNGHEQGRMAGRIAGELFKGKRIEEVPVQKAEMLLELDYPSLVEHHINRRNLPAEARLLNEPVSWYVRHSREVVIGLLVVLFVCMLLAVFLVLRQRLLDNLREILEQRQRTLKAMGEGVVVTNACGAITVFNASAEHLTGISAQEAMGQQAGDMLMEAGGTIMIREIVRRVLLTPSIGDVDEQVIIQSRDGKRHIVSLTVSPLHGPKGKLFGVVLVLRDVTEEHERLVKIQRENSVRRQAMRMGNFVSLLLDSEGVRVVGEDSLSGWPVDAEGRLLPSTSWLSGECWECYEQALRQMRNKECNDCCLLLSSQPDAKKQQRHYRLSLERISGHKKQHDVVCGVLQDISDLKNIELHHIDDQRLIESILENLPVSIFLKDADDNFRYVRANKAYAELINVDDHQRIQGSVDADFLPENDPLVEKIRCQDEEVMATGKMYTDDMSYINNQGRAVWLHTIKLPMVTLSGNRMLLGMHLETTQSHELELARQRAYDRMNSYVNMVSFVNRLLTCALDMTHVREDIEKCLRLIGEHYGADRCFIYTYNDASLELASRYCAWVAPHVTTELSNAQLRMALLPGWNERFQQGKYVVIGDSDNPPEDCLDMVDYVRYKGSRAVLVGGIQVSNSLYGFVGIDYMEHPHPFSDVDQELLQACTSAIGLVLTRQKQWQRLMDSEAFMRQIIDSIAMPLTIFDRKRNIVLANPSAAELYGSTREELVGQSVEDHPEWQEEKKLLEPLSQTLLDERPHSVEAFDHENRTIVATSQPLLDRDGKMMYVLCLNIDVSMREEQRQVLQNALKQAQEGNRAKSMILSTVSHELRTPLNVIIGYTDILLRSQRTAAEQSEDLNMIEFASNSLLDLINDLLDMSKLEAKRMTLQPCEFDLSLLLGKLLSGFKLRANKKGLNLSSDVVGLERCVLVLDERRIRQILANLMSNAVKYTAEGGIHVSVSFIRENEGETGTGSLMISVKDTGMGIAPEQQARIFEPFIQDDAAVRSSSLEGTGLGLSICQRLVMLMGGRMTLESHLGGGSVFTVKLPNVAYRLLQMSEELPRQEKLSYQQLAQVRPCRILAVDDVELNVRMLSLMLRKLGHECVVATSGKAALAALAKDHDFDLVFTDLRMPEPSGVQLAKCVRTMPGLEKLPIVVVTANLEMTEQEQQCFDDVLFKPYTGDNITQVIKNVLAKKP